MHHVKYLVIDEADRLLQQSYQDWLNKVLDASYAPSTSQGLIQEKGG